METMHTPLLQRTGAVLLALGLIPLAALAYGLHLGLGYPIVLSLGPMLAGVFLWRGSLRAALWVRWCAVLLLAAGLGLLFFLPLMQPFSLTFTQLRLGQGPSWTLLVGASLGLLLLAWIVWQLGRAPIHAARAGAGQKPRDMRIPVAAGLGLVVALGIFMVTMRVGPAAQQARALAQEAVGDGYRLHITWLSRVRTGAATQVSAVVTAWDDDEIRQIPVQWEAP